MELILNDPVALPWASGDGAQAVFWVRIYRDVHSAVVIIADVPANPGPWPDTVDTQIAGHLTRSYLHGGLEVRWFMCYPGRYPSGQFSRTRYFEAGSDGNSRTWPRGQEEIPRPEISAAIGRPLQLMPAHEEVLERVLAAGGHLEPGAGAPRFIIVPAGSIPPPGNAFRCAHRERYRQLLLGRGQDQLTRTGSRRMCGHSSSASSPTMTSRPAPTIRPTGGRSLLKQCASSGRWVSISPTGRSSRPQRHLPQRQ